VQQQKEDADVVAVCVIMCQQQLVLHLLVLLAPSRQQLILVHIAVSETAAPVKLALSLLTAE
jgi:hypothetical protein